MKFMEKFEDLANKTLLPIAVKLANQKHLASIRDGMVVAIPLSILGGICLIISTPPFKPETLGDWGFISDLLIVLGGLKITLCSLSVIKFLLFLSLWYLNFFVRYF